CCRAAGSSARSRRCSSFGRDSTTRSGPRRRDPERRLQSRPMDRVARARRVVPRVVLVATLLAACQVRSAAPPTSLYVYEDLPESAGFPVDENVLISEVDAVDVRAMRAHAWALWAGLTAPSRSTWNGQRLPVFETWYSAAEVFEDRYRE